MKNSGPTPNPGNTPAPQPDSDTPARSRSKRELTYGAIAFITGFVLLPLLIYTVGSAVLGPYAGGKSMSTFLGEFYGHLLGGAGRTWFIALSPYLAFWILRLIFRRNLFGKPQTSEATPEPAVSAGTVARTADPNPRREPFIST